MFRTAWFSSNYHPFYFTICRSSHRRCSVRKGVLRYFAKFIGKNQCQSLFFNKVAGLKSATLLKETLAQMFSCEFCKIFRNTFCTEDLWATASIFDQVYCFVAKRQTDLKLLLIIAVTYTFLIVLLMNSLSIRSPSTIRSG